MSQTRFLKSMITPTKVEPTSSDTHIAGVASGVWSVQDQLEARRGGTWPDASVPDPDTLIENNFSTFVYTGNGSTRTITNGIDLANRGGLVWTKCRSDNVGHELVDTVRGAEKYLESHSSNQEQTSTGVVNGFTSSGYTMLGTGGGVNDNNKTYVSWTFKKAPKFFSIFKFTHSNGTDTVKDFADDGITTLGMVAVKKLDQANQNWNVWHRSLSASNKKLRFNTTGAEATLSEFSISGTTVTFVSGEASADYVMYVWQHDTSAGSMIKCDSFTADGSGEVSVDLGFEPQFLMIKNRQSADNWIVNDTMRGYFASDNNSGADGKRLRWDTDAQEGTEATLGHPNATGFATDGDGPLNNHTYIYMAIRRPIMGPITDATKVFATVTGAGTPEPTYVSGFPVDMAFERPTNSSQFAYISSRLTEDDYLQTGSTSAETNDADILWEYNTGYHAEEYDSNNQAWMWRRAKGFFDVVPVIGASGAMTINHNLGVAPEFLLAKRRDGTSHWYADMVNNYLRLNTDGANLGSTVFSNFTSTTFQADSGTFSSGESWIVYLFATLAGVSKVGSYTGTGDSSAQTIDCGFTSGARFVLIKCTSHTGQWYLFDSTRGITSTKNDGVLFLNANTANQAETSAFGSAIDAIQPDSSGFKVQYSDINTDGRSFLFYAIA